MKKFMLGVIFGSIVAALLVSLAHNEVRLRVAYPKGTFRGGSTFILKDSIFGTDYWIPISSVKFFCHDDL